MLCRTMIKQQVLKYPGGNKKTVDEPQATQFLSRDYYGWFNKIARGVYQIAEKGKKELAEWQIRMQL